MNEHVNPATLAVSLNSPRFSLRTADFDAVDQAIRQTGHVVLDNVWNTHFLSELRQESKSRFEADDRRLEKGESLQDVHGYMGGEMGVGVLFGTDAAAVAKSAQYSARISMEFERSGMPALVRYLLNGTCVLGDTVASLRRIDPRFPVRFIGLHSDGQLNLCSSQGRTSKRELTLWTPLQDCVEEDTPRLLLLHRRETVDTISLDGDKDIVLLHTDPLGEAANLANAGNDIDRFFDRVYREKECFAPHVAFGSAVLFDCHVVHGSYRTDQMKTPRYSIDMRMVPEFRTTLDNCTFVGMSYRASRFPRPGIMLLAKGVAPARTLALAKLRAKEFAKFTLGAPLRKMLRLS
jgi:hypothetical protein